MFRPLLACSLLAVLMAAVHAEDRLIQVYLEDKGQGQKLRLWLPDGVEVLRGVIIDLGNPHGGDRPDFQAFARANRFATLGTLLRWPATLKDDLVAIIADLAARSGHAELVNVPWILTGFSRSVGACSKVAIADPDRVLAVVAGGSNVDGSSPAGLATWLRVPVTVVHGSADPFVHSPEGVAELRWFTRDWPAIRERRLPWAAGIQWGAGHSPGTGFVLHAAFLKDQLAVRLPADWDPRQGPPALRNGIAEADGWLGDPATWSTPDPVVRRASEFTGDARTALWIPGSASAQVWRSYVVKEPQIAIAVADGAARISGPVPEGTTRILWRDGDQELGSTDAATPLPLPKGLRCLFAEAVIGDRRAVSRPLLVLDGVDIPLGEEAMRPTQAPLALLQLEAGDKATLAALQQRAAYAGPGRWKPVFRSDFTTGLGPWTPGRLKGQATVVDGALRLESANQFVVALPYDWPSELAVEYRCRSLGEQPNDLGLMLDGGDGGDRPWRAGVMFHFGEHGNRHSCFQVAGDTDRTYPLRFTPGRWHAVRVERIGRTLTATVDGASVGEPQVLSDNQLAAILGHRLGFYTVTNTAEFADVVVSVREPLDPAAVQPALPAAEPLAALAGSLVGLLDNPYAEQRNLASEQLTRFAMDLAPALRGLQAAGIPGAKGRARVETLLANLRPQ